MAMQNFQPLQSSQNSSQPTSESQSNQVTSEAVQDFSSDDGQHLNEISIEGIESGVLGGGDNLPSVSQDAVSGTGGTCDDVGGQVPSGVLNRDQFYTQFDGAFKIIGLATGFQSFRIQPEEQQAAREASDAVYDTALDLEWHWVISGGGRWLQRLTVIGFFFMGKAELIKLEKEARIAEIKQMQAEKKQKEEQQSTEAQQKALNDPNTPPEGWEWMKGAQS